MLAFLRGMIKWASSSSEEKNGHWEFVTRPCPSNFFSLLLAAADDFSRSRMPIFSALAKKSIFFGVLRIC